MLIFLGVEDFAKIESAKVCINRYTLLVGPNNSGKTYFMQLIQGVNERLANLVEEDALQVLVQKENPDAGYIEYVLSQHNILPFAACLNKSLEVQKEQIVREIFGREMTIGKLYVDIFLEAEESYRIVLVKNMDRAIMMNNSISSIIERLLEENEIIKDDRQICILIRDDKVDEKEKIMFLITAPQTAKRVICFAFDRLFEYQHLFFPASRTGIMLLYREFFAHKADNFFSYQFNGELLAENRTDYSELTQPVYQFLRFLQTYSESVVNKFFYKEEIEFFEEKLIEGRISTNKQSSFSYDSKTDDVSVPMYMASSMVNEIAPFVLALTGGRRYDGFIIDEIEASLHPKKQMELVRFLNRLSNKGVKLILSTHSDTFVSKVNNFYLLSKYAAQNKEENFVQKLGLEKEDLISPDKLYVYEFVNQMHGRSIVKEIMGDNMTGFPFDLFTDSAMDLYNEAAKIGEMLQNDKP